MRGRPKSKTKSLKMEDFIDKTKEKEKAEVKKFNLHKKISYEEFKSLDMSLQQLYLDWLVSEYGMRYVDIARLFQVSHYSVVYNYINNKKLSLKKNISEFNKNDRDEFINIVPVGMSLNDYRDLDPVIRADLLLTGPESEKDQKEKLKKELVNKTEKSYSTPFNNSNKNKIKEPPKPYERKNKHDLSLPFTGVLIFEGCVNEMGIEDKLRLLTEECSEYIVELKFSKKAGY